MRKMLLCQCCMQIKPYDKVRSNLHQKETKSVFRFRKECGIYKHSRFTQHGNMVVFHYTNPLIEQENLTMLTQHFVILDYFLIFPTL